MAKGKKKEAEAIRGAGKSIRVRQQVVARQKKKIMTEFAKRLENALNLVKNRHVKKYVFKPSGRVIWAVRGRKAVYQVIPDAGFCNCDDYYFRVIGRKKHLCYHMIAQRMAEALHLYDLAELPDREYPAITEMWRVKEEAAAD